VSNGLRLGLFYTIVRPEERALLAAAERRSIPMERLPDDEMVFGFERNTLDVDGILNRSVSHSRALYAGHYFAHYGIPAINPPDVLERAGDKILASLRLSARGIPTPRTIVAMTPEMALKALDTIGYPAVLKPPVGSWGRLMAKVNDRDSAEQILEHKGALSSPVHSIFYIQEYVPKPERDLRVFVVGDRVVGAMLRHSESWRTNAARGAHVEPLPVTPELSELSLRAAEAMGGGVLAVDLMESPQGLVVHEVNPTPEFKALQAATGIEIADAILDYALEQWRR
jgi:[lysine-biosynthesis-protein LysW]--L-2-aminoadipate ligase